MKEEQRRTSDLRFDGKLIKVTYDTVELENGAEAWREVVHHPGASAIVVQLDDGRILLEKQYRYALGSFTMEIPAGKLDRGEDHRLCAERELEEETGYRAKTWVYLGPLATSPGFCNEIIHLYYATDVTKGAQALDDDEFLECKAYTLDEVDALVKEGAIGDAKTLAAFYLAQPYLQAGLKK